MIVLIFFSTSLGNELLVSRYPCYGSKIQSRSGLPKSFHSKISSSCCGAKPGTSTTLQGKHVHLATIKGSNVFATAVLLAVVAVFSVRSSITLDVARRNLLVCLHVSLEDVFHRAHDALECTAIQ